MQTLKQQRTWFEKKDAESCTLPRYSTQDTVQVSIIPNTDIRLLLVDPDELINERLLKSFIGKYIFANYSGGGAVRAITSVDTETGTPNSYYVIIESPFPGEVAVGDQPLKLVDTADYEPVYCVAAAGQVVKIDGVETFPKPSGFTIENSSPKAPIVLGSDGVYYISNVASVNIISS